MFNICCIGHLTIDRIITPNADAQMPGGTAYYFSSAMAQLPVKYKLVTALAAPDVHLADELVAAAIDMTIHPSEHTLFFENRYAQNSDQRQQRVLQVAHPFSIEQLSGCTSELYHLGSLLAGDIPASLIEWLSLRGRVSIDAQGFVRMVQQQKVVATAWEDKLALLPLVHTLKASEEEAFQLTGEQDMYVAGRMLESWGVKEVIITQGSRGSILFIDGQIFVIPAYRPGEVKDATGCGDTYIAGYLYQRFLGADPQTAGCFAAAMATIKIARSGPFKGAESDILKLIASNKVNAVN